MADDMTEPIAVRIRIRGRVQGVWYRAWTVQEARKSGLSGWVRNRRDGSVEALFCGAEPAVRDMIANCRSGPPAARVDRIDETPDQPRPEDGFHQLPTE
jgi:acylphosphatase